jgi:quinol monooxygenase YgiN
MKHAIIATMEVKPGTRDEVVRALVANRERSLRDEPGTLQFEVIVPNDDLNTILLYELYADTQAFHTHFKGPSVAKAMQEVGQHIISMKGSHSKLGTEIVESAA